MIVVTKQEINALAEDIAKAHEKDNQWNDGALDILFRDWIYDQPAYAILFLHDLIFPDNRIPCGHVPVPIHRRVDRSI